MSLELSDPLDEAEVAAGVEFRRLPHGLCAVLIVGPEAKVEALRRIAHRQAEREAQAKAERRRVKRQSLARSNPRPGRRGGAA